MKKIILTIWALIYSMILLAETPQWKVESSQYEFSMQVICIFNLDGTESTDLNDQLGAFVGDECRGAVNPVYINGIDRYVYYLNIMSSTTEYETITLKFYNASKDTIVEALNTLVFKKNDQIGNATDPVIISNIKLNNSQNTVKNKLLFTKVSRELTIRSEYSITQIRIFDMAGKMLHYQNQINEQIYSVQLKESSIYIVKILLKNGQVITQKFYF